MKTAAEILTAARARIENPEHWTTSKYARDAAGVETLPREPRAVCWCAIGALQASYEQVTPGVDEFTEASMRAYHLLYEATGQDSVVDINDHVGHPAVLSLYDRAIELSKAEPATKS